MSVTVTSVPTYDIGSRYRVRYHLRSRAISTVESHDTGRRIFVRSRDFVTISYDVAYDILRCRLRYRLRYIALYRRYIASYRVKRTMPVRYFSVQRPYIERTSQCSDLRYGHLRCACTLVTLVGKCGSQTPVAKVANGALTDCLAAADGVPMSSLC